MSASAFLQQRTSESARAHKARIFDYSLRVVTVLRDMALKWLAVDGLVAELFHTGVLAAPTLCDSMACEVHDRLMEHIAKVAFTLALGALAPTALAADICATTLPLSTAPTSHLFQPPSLLLYIASVLETYTALRSFEAFLAPLLAAQRVPPRELQDQWDNARRDNSMRRCVPRPVSDVRELRSGPAAATRGRIRQFCVDADLRRVWEKP